MKHFPFAFGAILLLALLAVWDCGAAFAHRVNVFAWLEGNKVIVEGNFGKNRPAMNAEVKVLNAANKAQLLTGRTNAQGAFTFPAPGGNLPRGIDIVLNAGEGHLNTWHLAPQELAAAVSAESATAAKAPVLRQGQPAVQSRVNESAPGAGVDLTPATVRAIIREEVQNAVAPMRRSLAEACGQGPSFTEIIGGIGWLMGIFGVIFYFMARRRAPENSRK